MKTKYRWFAAIILSINAAQNAQAADNEPDSLAHYIAAAAEQSPQVQAAWFAYEAARVQSDGKGRFPMPELSLGVFPKAMQQVNGKQRMSIEIMQMLPWAATLRSQRAEAQWQSEAARQQFRQASLRIATQVQRIWWALLAEREQEQQISAQLNLVADLATLSAADYRSGRSGARMSDLPRLEAESAQLREARDNSREQQRTLQAQLNVLLHRAENSPITLPDSLTLRPLPSQPLDSILLHDPLTLAAQAEGKAQAATARRAKAEGAPMIGVGLEYMLNQRTTMAQMPKMNGDDMLMARVKITLPNNPRTTRANIRAAQLRQEAATQREQARHDEIRTQLLTLGQRIYQSDRQLLRIAEQRTLLLSTFQLLRSEYANGLSPLSELLNLLRDLAQLNLQEAQAKAERNIAAAELDELCSE